MTGFGNGCWENRRAFVIGGGPSLVPDDVRVKLRHELTIGCNMAYLLNVLVNVSLDLQVVRKMVVDPRWHDWRERGGDQLWIVNAEPSPDEPAATTPIRRLKRTQDWPNDIDAGVYCRSNSGLSALHLAYLAGANPIYLLGFDLRPVEKLTSNWHGEYPQDWRTHAETAYAHFLNAWREVAPNLAGREVVNLNPASALDCFPKRTLGEIL